MPGSFVLTRPRARFAYEGFVATGGRMLTQRDFTNKQFNSRSEHVATEDLIAIKILFSNFACALPDNGVGAPLALTASVESPPGTIQTIVKSLGSSSFSVPDVGTLFSDYTPVSIAKNSTFAIKIFGTNPNGLCIRGAQLPGGNEQFQWAVSGLTDLTTSGAAIPSLGSPAFVVPPFAIIGVTKNRSVLVFGDSRTASAGASYSDGNVGLSVASFGIPFVNIAWPSATAAQWTSHATARAAIYPFGSEVIGALGINDMATLAASPSVAAASLNGLLPLFGAPNKSVITIEPYTDSVNGWISPDDQTIHVGAGGVVDVSAFNTIIRAGLTNANWYYDIFDAVAISRAAPHWKVVSVGPDSPPYTGDGLHPFTPGQNLELHSGLLVPRS